MATGDFLTWSIQAQDAPAHVGRLLQTILLNEGVVDVAGDSFKVAENTGSDMNITIGSGTVGDLAVVEGDDTAGQGVYVHEAQNGTVTRAVAASDPSDDRIDLVVLQNYDDEADSSGNNDAEVEVIEGTPAGSPSAPALPDSAIPLAEIDVGAGVTAITDADITDTRENAKTGGSAPGGLLGYSERTSGFNNFGPGFTAVGSLALSSLDVGSSRRIRIASFVRATADDTDGRFDVRLLVDGGQVQSADTQFGVGSAGRASILIEHVTTLSGSHDFATEVGRDGTDTGDLVGSSTAPLWISVTDLGPA